LEDAEKMNKSSRLIFGVILGLTIHYCSLMVIPSIGFIDEFVKKHQYITRGDVIQTSFLVLSFVLIILFSRGKVSKFSLKAVKIGKLKNPILLSIVFAFVIISINMLLRIIIEKPGQGFSVMMMPGGLLKPILSVWILASISEEIFFRGLLQSLFMPLKEFGFKLYKSFISVPVMVCAVWFGLGHLGLLRMMRPYIVVGIVVNATVLGLVAGYYREKTGSIIPAIVVHMVFNIVGTFVAVLFMSVVL